MGQGTQIVQTGVANNEEEADQEAQCDDNQTSDAGNHGQQTCFGMLLEDHVTGQTHYSSHQQIANAVGELGQDLENIEHGGRVCKIKAADILDDKA